MNQSKQLKRNALSRRSNHVFHTVIFIFLTLWSLSMAFCLFWLVNNSLKEQLIYEIDQLSLVKNPRWKNYINAFTELEVRNQNLFRMIGNTLYFTTFNIVGQITSSLLFSYVLARFKFPGRNFLYFTVIFRMVYSPVGTLAATYRLYDTLGLTNSPFFWVTGLTGTANFLVFYTVFRGVSGSYAEAAYLDGAGHIRVFFQIMVPQVMGVVTAMVISSFIVNWNEFMSYMLFLPDYPSLALGLYELKTIKEFEDYPLVLSAVVLSIIPVVILYASFQKYFIKIDISGGLKG